MRFLLLMLLPLLLLGLGCEVQQDTAGQSRAVQEDVVGRGFAAVPPFEVTQFTAREDVNWYLQETEGRHDWYVYVTAMTGEPMFFVVSRMQPRNICVSLSAPDRVSRSTGGAVVTTAPALDGLYYSGGSCDAWYMEDRLTGGFIQISGTGAIIVASKTLLGLETDPQYKPLGQAAAELTQ